MSKNKYDVLLGLSEKRINLVIAKEEIESSLKSDFFNDSMKIHFISQDGLTRCAIKNDDILNKIKIIIEEEIKEVEEQMDKYLKLDV